MLQRQEGLGIERLRHIDDHATSPHYSRPGADGDRLCRRDDHQPPVSVTDEQVAELVTEFGRQGVIELTYLIGLENLRARVNRALDITDQGFTSGDACQVPVPADVTRPSPAG